MVQAALGQLVRLFCPEDGSPDPYSRWQKDGRLPILPLTPGACPAPPLVLHTHSIFRLCCGLDMGPDVQKRLPGEACTPAPWPQLRSLCGFPEPALLSKTLTKITVQRVGLSASRSRRLGTLTQLWPIQSTPGGQGFVVPPDGNPQDSMGTSTACVR